MRPIVVVNKIDRETSQPEEVVSSVEDLICEFAQDESYLESPFVFASGANGFCYKSIEDFKSQKDKQNLGYILDQIIESVPSPEGEVDSKEFRLLVT